MKKYITTTIVSVGIFIYANFFRNCRSCNFFSEKEMLRVKIID